MSITSRNFTLVVVTNRRPDFYPNDTETAAVHFQEVNRVVIGNSCVTALVAKGRRQERVIQRVVAEWAKLHREAPVRMLGSLDSNLNLGNAVRMREAVLNWAQENLQPFDEEGINSDRSRSWATTTSTPAHS